MTGRFSVDVSRAAEADLAAIVDYLTDARGADDAAAFVTAMLDRVATLAQFPLRGAIPRELEEAGETDFRQLLFGRFRLFYEVDGSKVTLVLVADGRRDIAALLRDRLVRSPSLR
ncbi:type II toxin-antitoxin system RelE/ParE family toxin [Sphingomonas rubra]|uniref:Toxin ParE1/3/4 n=1 Tax=Sphingomonas rubra TaxID=634430 RepID=A0A1I5U380_9SPHN|nr:type II toxin-antitoxin system RelE/ParE family toxin [Sphingomonas rubra]SFP89016.1 toxin ParE1/3/4 [Sphingomonas rubra]